MSVYNSKISIALRDLDSKMLNRFKKFVHSPYFNSNEAVTSLYELLYKQCKKGLEEEKWMSREEVFVACYPEEEYNDLRLRKLFSLLMRLYESFLMEEHFRSNPLLETSQLLSNLSVFQHDNLYNQAIKSARALSKKLIEKSGEYYYYQYKIEKEIYKIEEYEIKRSQKLNVERLLSNLDKFYFAEKLRYYYKVLSQKNVVEHDYEVLFLDEILKHIEETGYEDDPHIYLHYLVVELSEKKDDQSLFDEVKKAIEKHIDIFPQNEARDIYNAAINFCIRQINKGNAKYLKEVFDLYVSGLQKEALLLKNELTPYTFRNMCICGLRLKYFDWVENFIEEKAPLINEKYRGNAVRYNKARLYFYKEEFKKVIPLLAQVEFNEINYTLGAKALLMATYYELREIDVLLSFVDSFRTYLIRHKDILPRSRYENYQNLVHFVKKLSTVTARDKEELQKLEEEINESSGIADIKWLKEKIAELKE